MAEHTFRCNDCPFATSDEMSREGHEHHAPKHGWLGHDETHVMYRTDGRTDGCERDADNPPHIVGGRFCRHNG